MTGNGWVACVLTRSGAFALGLPSLSIALLSKSVSSLFSTAIRNIDDRSARFVTQGFE